MEQRYQQRTFSYGNFRSQHPDSLAQGWETSDARARFGTNWMGLRGRLSILSEGYSNADFRSRISATYNFVREVLELAGEQTAAIKQVVRTADRTNNDSLAIRSRLGSPVFHEVIAEITGDAGEGSNGFARRQRTGEYRAVRMPVYDRFTATRKEARPAAYLIPSRLTEIIDLLLRQGIAVDVSTSDWRTRAEAFTVDSIAVGPLFEGHRTIQVEGRWSTQPVDTLLSSGWYLVRTDQPLGTLAGYLLEPASEDGVVTWNFLDRELEPRAVYPILRAHRLPPVPSTALP
ncbi:MAG TPA: hypothetical protein VHH32_00425 [Gemmatimonadales bacterium]|nr:hypothetical protein [Gemmatimonadales bacterium]